MYQDRARALVLALKHGDRPEIAKPAGRWLARAARPLLAPDILIAPVPLHWTRMLHRRYNQSALLSAALARETGAEHCPDLLRRHRRTPPLEGMTADERFRTLSTVISVPSRREPILRGRPVLLVDDVMTSGATLSACSAACYASGAGSVSVVTLARVAKDT